MTFAKGASLDEPARLFNASLAKEPSPVPSPRGKGD